jgi:tripartite-type tricarboxylate transporter receptor subunit TctC
MKLLRREFLQIAAGAAVLPVISRVAIAEAYPSRPVHLIVGFPPGGGTDVMARLIGQSLSERLAQPFVIENRPGAGSNIGTEVVVHAPPDGYTLLLSTIPNAVNATLYEHLSYNFIRDIARIATIGRVPNVMTVHPTFPAKTLPEFIQYAKANPGKITMASDGNGASAHVTGELFKMMAGLNLLHVPYRGAAPALSDLMGGQVQMMFATMPAAIQYVRAGKLRALAVTTATRSGVLLDVPAVGEVVPGYDASTWYGVCAPRNTPIEIIDKLNSEIRAATADPKLKARLEDLGAEPLTMNPTDFERFVVNDTEKWAKVVKFAGIKAE